MMNAEELSVYDALPDVVIVYRGCYEHNKVGICWTLSSEVAERFTTYNRYRCPGQTPLLIKARAKKKNIVAVKIDRNEQEIITYWPRRISTTPPRTLVSKPLSSLLMYVLHHHIDVYTMQSIPRDTLSGRKPDH